MGVFCDLVRIEPSRSLPCFVYNKRLALFEHRGVFADEAEARANPLIRQRAVGSYFTMKCDYELKNAGDRKYSARDIKIIDHNRQTWKTITFMDALRNSGLFDDTPVGNLTDWGKRVLFPRYTGDQFTFQNLLGQYGPDVRRHYATAAAVNVGARQLPDDFRQLFKGTIKLPNGVSENDKPGQKVSTKSGKELDTIKKLIKVVREITEDIYSAGLQDEFKTAVEAKTATGNVLRIITGKILPADVPKVLDFIDEFSKQAPVTKGGNGAAGIGDYAVPVSLGEIEELINDGQQVPIQLYILRPHQTFRMGAMVMGKGGEETGFTVFGNANFELADEATTKTAIGHYTCKF